MDMKPLIWNLAWSYNEKQYKNNLERLKEYDEGVYNDVMNSNPKSWCRAFYKIDGKCCEDVENNTVESFNNSIGKAREKPVMPMLETIRRLEMTRISLRKAIANSHPGKFTTYVQKFLDEEHEDAAKCTIWPCTSGKFEVKISGQSERVDMTLKKCTCCKWDICGIPCQHAYGVILKNNLNPDDYVSDWFLTSRLRETYNEAMIPQRGSNYWARGDVALVTQPPEPLQLGRKKKDKKQKRKKGINESPSKKKSKKNKKNNKDKEIGSPSQTKPKRIMHCKKCGQGGHNSRSCAKRAKRTHGEGSGSQSTELMSQVDQA
ncbi:uncharacterized protein LOC9324683 isoform X2 [Arabidopsis lyrata subsp. lyrata]|uniref:uncharacterized protein LOC9324683 isoform X2 n=1 Tax=Arabidopsis lyrata subsp. lyrata TaxID=81972 RepID=UPI000A29E691|nr:uncharacterized protein LOC9324683 isoform X2 [Arabidopsis lyrata subsp. lyrata]|eukprot:XP_020891538.1 uncharacterized protein LOC9324683 isoform X2 [Arabidopsis lyrata subsp. lyrata]